MATILIGGGSGLVGRHLSELLTKQGHRVSHLSRQRGHSYPYPRFYWNIDQQTIDPAALENIDVVINLAGAGIADARWSASRKKQLISSRVMSTQLLRKALEGMAEPPKTFISASAVGYYGDRGDEWLPETAEPGDGFLADCCRAWEAAAAEVANTGLRTVIFRIGLVLAKDGGALARLRLPLKLGMAPHFGTGQQYYPWVHIHDLCRLMTRAITDEQMRGVFNAAGPEPVTHRTFMQALVQVTGRRSLVFGVPAFVLRLMMGEMADVVLSSNRVSVDKLQQSGFKFHYTGLPEALRAVLA